MKKAEDEEKKLHEVPNMFESQEAVLDLKDSSSKAFIIIFVSILELQRIRRLSPNDELIKQLSQK